MSAAILQPAVGRSGSFASRLHQFGDSPAIATEDAGTLSYRQLAARVDSLVVELGGYQRLILVEASNTPDSVTAWLAGLAGGHAVLLTAEANESICSRFRPDARFLREANGLRLELDQPASGLHPDLALLLSTSGSTGSTKLVRLSAAAVEANAASIATYLGLGPGSRALTTLPMHYSYGLSVVNSHLFSGGTLLLTSRSVTDPVIWQTFEAAGGTSFAGVPYTFDLLDRMGFWARAPRTLDTITQAGGRLAPDRVRSIGEWADARNIRFFVMYGQTEATARIAFLPPEKLRDAPDCIGIPIPGGTIALRGPDGQLVEAAGSEGELIYRGPNVMMGYADTRADLARGPELDELATGDMAVRTADGLYRIVGRKSRIVKPFGLRVSLDELESFLAARNVPAAVTGNDELIAVAVLGSSPENLAFDLASRTKLPENLFVILQYPELPRLPNGKTDYRALLESAIAQRATQIAELGAGDRIMAAFTRIFPGPTIGLASSFNQLGGDSLSYVQMSLELEAALGQLPSDWERMTIAELAAVEAPAVSRRSGVWRRIPSDILLRAVAILAVIINHMSAYPTGGGSDALLLLVGYSLARFHCGRLVDGKGPTVLAELFARVMLPYLAILALYAGLRRPVPIENFLLVGNLNGPEQGFLQPFWFLDVLFQVYLIFVVLFMVPHVRAFAAADPFRFGMVLVAAGFVLKIGGLLLFHPAQTHLNRTPDAVLLLVALGWTLWFARNWRERALLLIVGASLAALTAGLVPRLVIWEGFPHSVGVTRAVWLAAALVLLLAVPGLLLPRPISTAVVRISASAYFIYLTHGLVVYAVAQMMPGSDPSVLQLAFWVALACLLGIAVHAAVARIADYRRSGD